MWAPPYLHRHIHTVCLEEVCSHLKNSLFFKIPKALALGQLPSSKGEKITAHRRKYPCLRLHRVRDPLNRELWLISGVCWQQKLIVSSSSCPNTLWEPGRRVCHWQSTWAEPAQTSKDYASGHKHGVCSLVCTESSSGRPAYFCSNVSLADVVGNSVDSLMGSSLEPHCHRVWKPWLRILSIFSWPKSICVSVNKGLCSLERI